MQPTRGARLVRIVVVALAAGAAAGGVALAAIPGASGVISACYGPTGLLRVIDESASCRESETPLAWNEVGPQGERGPQGPAGTAEAYATINADGVVNPTFSRGITNANVTHPRTGVYCLRDLGFQPRVAIANGRAALRIEADGTLNAANQDTVVTTALNVVPNPDAFLGICDSGAATSTVRIYVAAGGALVDRAFSILLDA